MSGNLGGHPTNSTKDKQPCIYDREAKELIDFMFRHLANTFYGNAKEIKPKNKKYVDKEHMIAALNILLPEECCAEILEYHDSKVQLSS